MKGKKLMIALASSLLLVGGTVSLAACNNGPVTPEVIAVTSVALDQTELGLKEGETAQLTATVLPENATDKTVTWESSDAEVATVANGLVTAVKAGEAVITAKAGDFSAKCNVKVVVKPEVTALGIEIDDLNCEILVDDEYYSNAVPIYTSIKTVGEAEGLKGFTVTSSDESKIIVLQSNSGAYWASGVATGKAKLVITSTFDSTKKEELEVEVVEPYVRGIALNTTGLYLVLGSEDFATGQLEADVTTFGAADDTVTFESNNPAVATVDEDGNVIAVAEGTAIISATAGEKVARCEVTVKPAGSAMPADGARTFKYSSADERLEILGALEKYAVENKLTGLTLYGDGGYVMYDPSVTKPAANYVPGFGFGILSEGTIDADMEKESNAAWKRYYHSYETSDPGSLNYMDDKGSVVGDLIGYVSSSYFDTFLNSSKDGYEWVNGLSKSETSRPIPVNEDPVTHLATKFKFPVKVGAELKYATKTENAALAEFNNREVALKDYITPYQIYYTQSYGLARSAENLEGSGSIKGAKSYYEKSGSGFNADAWNNIGIKAYEQDGQSWLEFEFNTACSPFYAMYYLASGMFAPVPEEFVLALGNGDLKEGVATWGKSNADGSLSPKDTYLSTGPYVVEQWDKDQQIVFGRNENIDDGKHYKIQGVHLNILAAAAQDPEAAFKEFLDGKLHACGIPSTKLDEYRSDPRATMTSDSSTYKLNLNTCDQDTWEQLFGINGSVAQTPVAQYWECEPAMANKDFVSGLSFALNRKELADSLGRTPAATYFASAYMSDPENGVSYNSTQAHEDAVASLIGEAAGTDEYGFSYEQAVASFQKAAEDMIAQGLYQEGDTITIEIAWQATSQISTTHNPIKKYLEDAFNTENNPLRLEVVSWVGAVWSDVYYKKMMLGQFDIGFGSISGNTYDPINFLEVLRSDNSSGFTLNWGLDTNSVDGSLVYNNEAYSFDALWTAADQGAYIEKGANSPLDFSYDEDSVKIEKDDDGNVLVTLDVREMNVNEGLIKTKFATLYAYGYVGEDAEYLEFAGTAEKAADQTGVAEGYVRYVVTFSATQWAQWDDTTELYAANGYFGLDTYFITEFFGVEGEPSYKESIVVTELP